MPKFQLDVFMPYRLATIANRVSMEFSDVYKDRFGLNVTEWRVIAHLSQTDESVSIRDLCLRVETEKSKVSRAVTRLVSRGIVQKNAHETDRRLLELQLTEKGHDLVAEIVPLALAYEQELLQRLGSDPKPFLAALETLFTRK